MKYVGNSSRGRSQGVMNIFRAPYRAHCAVIFATAQLSCYYKRPPALRTPYRWGTAVPELVKLNSGHTFDVMHVDNDCKGV